MWFNRYTVLFSLFMSTITYGQNDSLNVPADSLVSLRPSTPRSNNFSSAEDPLSPSKAAFYSAVIPGLGQMYNKSYWKLPIVYGGLATSLYFYFDNNKEYHYARDIYKRRLLGYRDDELSHIDDDRIIRAQRTYQRNRDLSLVITIGIYILNIVDANVEAHLRQFNVDDNLTFEPTLDYNEFNYTYQMGVRATYRFK